MSGDIPLAFQVAVLGDDGHPIGSGLVLDGLRVVTCTHIVAHATTGDPNGVPRLDVDVKLRTIPWMGGDPLLGRLRNNAWRAKSPTLGDRGLRDLAVLEFAKPLDGWSDHCAIYPGSSFPQNEAPLFGFTRAQPDGVRTGVFIKGEVADGWIAIDAAPNAQYRVQGGFSGAPLFDPETQTALGLVAEADTGEGRTGFVIPGRAILDFLQSLPDLRDLAEKVRARAFVRNAPELPRKLMPRTSLVNLVKAMLSRDSTVGLVGLRGMGGIGKSVAACLIANDDWVRQRFYDGVEWISVGENKSEEDLKALQTGLLSRLGGRIERDQTMEGVRQAIEKVLANRRMLFIVDDVWTRLAVQAFRFRAPRCAVVYTSRRRADFDDCSVMTRDVELLALEEAEDLFRLHAKLTDDGPLPPVASAILGHCNCHALAIVVAGAMLGEYPDEGKLILQRFVAANVADVVASVPDYRRSASFPQQETSIFQIIKVSYDFLEPSAQEFLKRLAIFPEDVPIPLAALEILGGKTMDGLKCRKILSRLDDAALLTLHVDSASPDRSTITMHDVQRDFVRALNKAPAADHRALVEGLKTRLGGVYFADGDRPWNEYFRRFIVHHLIGAGMNEELFELLMDPDWIAHRLRAKDQVFDLIADYDRALSSAECA
jgi:hypothetical protein